MFASALRVAIAAMPWLAGGEGFAIGERELASWLAGECARPSHTVLGWAPDRAFAV